MIKNQLRALLAVAMTAVFLAGCGNTKEEQDAPAASIAEPIPEGDQAAAAPAQTEEAPAAEGSQEAAPALAAETQAPAEEPAQAPEAAPSAEAVPAAEPAPADETAYGGDQFVGQWTGEEADKAYMTIIPTDTFGVYDVVLQWRDSAATFAEWDMTAAFDEGSGSIQYSDGARFYVTLSENGPEERTQEWSGSSGKFFFDGQALAWEDSMEKDNTGTRFVRVTTYAPSAEVLANEFFKPLCEIPVGTSGAVLEEARTAYELLQFADRNAIWSNDLSELRTNLTAAWAGLSADEKSAVDTNLFSVHSIIVNAAVNWNDYGYLFIDSGIDAPMQELLANRTALEGFYRLFDTTVSSCTANQ